LVLYSLWESMLPKPARHLPRNIQTQKEDNKKNNSIPTQKNQRRNFQSNKPRTITNKTQSN
jgi:hypothetical protein